MTRHRLTIQPDIVGGKIAIDGHDISHAVRRVAATLEAGCPARVELELGLVEMDPIDVDAEVTVHMSDAVRDALIRLGWAAPGESTPQEET